MAIHKILGGALGFYNIVPINEAHIRVLQGERKVFSNREGYKGEYWTVPFITKMQRLPLTNIRIDVPDVKLHDKEMAQFMCDIVCFVNIDNVTLAAERTTLTAEERYYTESVKVVANDFRAIMESISRTVATNQTLLEIYQDRSKLDEAVTKEVAKVFPQWGLVLVDLEVKDLKDVPLTDEEKAMNVKESSIIRDIEAKIAARINADARVKIAEEGRRATIEEAKNKKQAEMEKAINEEEWGKRQIEKDRTLAIARQDQMMATAKKETEANEQKIEALRKTEVGTADVLRQATIQRAEAVKSESKREAGVLLRVDADPAKDVWMNHSRSTHLDPS
jgi:uncharacterized membrane protein YqiK